MKKLLTMFFVLVLAINANAQEKKSVEGAAKELHLTTEQFDQIKVLANERNQKIGEVKKLQLDSDDEKEKIQEIMNTYFPKINNVLGKDKVKEWNAYWKN
ncbi:hypothetical protein [Flavobacterium sp.]|uniref:hypothetical protein n=1 Tax=Flavobacterium sp. TaxID=239 RepID=UPI003C5C3D04